MCANATAWMQPPGKCYVEHCSVQAHAVAQTHVQVGKNPPLSQKLQLHNRAVLISPLLLLLLLELLLPQHLLLLRPLSLLRRRRCVVCH